MSDFGNTVRQMLPDQSVRCRGDEEWRGGLCWTRVYMTLSHCFQFEQFPLHLCHTMNLHPVYILFGFLFVCLKFERFGKLWFELHVKQELTSVGRN